MGLIGLMVRLVAFWQFGRGGDPVAERAAADQDPVPREDVLLPVEQCPGSSLSGRLPAERHPVRDEQWRRAAVPDLAVQAGTADAGRGRTLMRVAAPLTGVTVIVSAVVMTVTMPADRRPGPSRLRDRLGAFLASPESFHD